MVFAPELRTHAQKVCSLYKKALRTLEAYYVERGPVTYSSGEEAFRKFYFACYRKVVRYHQVLLRKQFDDNRCVCDPVEQRRLLWSGEHELFLQKHPIPVAKFPKSLGIAAGVAHGRVSEPPDWVLDYWHPLEKAQYPEYFARREKRKCEYIEKWRSGIVY